MLKIVKILIFSAFAVNLGAQTTFQRYITVPDTALLSRKIVGTSDGNIAISGALAYMRPPLQSLVYDGLLTKINANGDAIWAKRFRAQGEQSVYIDDLEATSDGGVLVLVMKKANSANQFGPQIVKVNSSGAVEWTKSLSGSSFYYLNSIQAVTGGFIVTGVNYNIHGSIIFKIDESGELVWKQNINNILVYANRLAETAEGDLFFPGGLNTNNSQLGANSRPLLLKMDADGNLLWSKIYTDSFTESLPLPAFLAFRKCLINGNELLLFSNNFSTRDLIITQTDLDGKPIQEKRFKTGGNTAYLPFLNAFIDRSGAILVATSNSHIDNRPILFQLTPSLEMTWIKSYRKADVDLYTFEDMHALADQSGYLFAGAFYENNQDNICIVKTDAMGEFAGRCCARRESIFQGTNGPVSAQDTILSLLPFPDYTSGQTNIEGASVQLFPICAAPDIAAEIQLSNTLICPGRCTEVGLKNTEPGGNYRWEFPGAVPDTSSQDNPGKICFGEKGSYLLMLLQDGCPIDTAILTVDGRPEIFPNAFTPNGDNANEVFKPIGQCPVERYELRIFNRWGNLVFESNSIDTGWDGTVNGALAPPDVYIYKVSYYAEINGIQTLLHNEMKEVTLLR